MASYDAVLNIITNGSSRIDKIISKVSQLESIVNSINKKPIDINAASAEKAVESFWKKTKILDANIQTIQKSSSSASKAFETYSARLNAANKVLESANPNTKKYAQALESQKKAQNGITQSINDMTKAERDLANAQDKREKAGTGLQEAEKAREAAKAIRQLADDYLLLGAYQQRSIKNGQVLKDQSAVTISQLSAQANALALVANNSKIASSEFNRFSIAGQLATGKTYEAQQKKLEALAFGLSPQAPRVNIGRGGESSIGAARSQVADLINSYSTIVKSEAAMSAFVARASELQSIVPIISNEFSALEEIIGRVKSDLSSAGLRGQSASAVGPATNLGTVSAFKQRESYQKKVNDELSRQVAIEDRINQGLLDQVQKTQLLNRLYQATDALSENRLDDAIRITREIDRQRFSLERLNRSQRSSQNTGSGGTYRTGVFSPIDGQKRLNAIYGANEMLASKLLALEAKGLNVSSEKLTLQNQINRIQSGTFDINLKNLDLENETLAAITRSISLLQQRSNILKSQSTGYPSSPIGGGVNMPGSPIFNQTPFLERRFGKKGGAAISEGLIGGAFPLLFGQGVAAAAGGGLGGALGGFAGGGLGFGLSLIGTAVGSALDELAAAAKDTAASLNDPITNFQKLADAGLLASKSQELQIKNLIEYGNSTKAAAIIQGELAKKIGVLAMRDMANLDNQSVRLGKAWAELNLQIQAAIAGPLAGLLEWTANMINLFTSGTRKKVDEQNFIDSLPADVRKEYIRQKQTNLYGAQPDAAIRAKFQGQARPLNLPKPNIDPLKLQEEQDKLRQEDRDKDDKLLQRKIEAEDLIRNSQNQSRQFEYQLLDLRRQSWDLQRRVNDDIFNKQQQIQRDQISNDRLRKQIAIDTVDLQYSKMISNEEGRAAAVLSAEADLVKMRSTNAAEIEVARRSLEIDIEKQQRDTQNYIYGLAREADSVRRATLNYEVQIEDYRIAQERKIAEIRRGVMREEEDIQIKRDRGSPVYQDATVGGSNGMRTLRGVPGISEYLTGDSRMAGAGYEPAGHGGSVYHEHIAAVNKQLRDRLIAGLKEKGFTIGSVDRNTNTFHGVQRAFDVPAYPNLQNLKLPDNRAGEQEFSRRVRAAVMDILGYSANVGTSGVVIEGSSRANTEAAITKANANDAVAQARPVVPGVPVSKIGGQQIALDNQGNKIKQDAIALQEKLNKLGEEGALQRVLDAARGENTVKQKNRELDILKAEAMSIDATASEKQAIATLDARSLETLKQIEEENKRIIERTSKSNAYNAKEKKAIADAAEKYLANARAALAVDKAMLETQQEMRFISEIAEKRLQLRNRDAAINVGFFGAGAQAYNQELTAGSGDSAKAAEQARLTRASEVQNEIVQIRENIQSLIDPTNQVIGGAKAIGGAFSDSFKAVFLGAKSGREALADFFQKTGEHFLEMATQMMAQKIILDLIGFGLSSFGLSGATGGIASGFQLPGQAFMPTGGSFKFANGGAFTNSVVSSPTLFQFANGGALGNGVMGEAGPEAVMPLSRGPGGRLGVDASGMVTASRDALQQAGQEVAASREALQQVSQSDSSKGAVGANGFAPQSKMFAESRQALATSARSQETASSESPAPLRIETIQVGKLDVVTVQQAKAIADASSARGNAKQTRLLQSSPAARRSMGI